MAVRSPIFCPWPARAAYGTRLSASRGAAMLLGARQPAGRDYLLVAGWSNWSGGIERRLTAA
jgi:hypothetical protein